MQDQNIKKRSKRYYLPGLISLVLLPFVFIHLAERERVNHSQGSIPFFLFDTSLPRKYPEIYRSILPQRNYVQIDFTGEYLNDKMKMSFAQHQIREILLKNDTVNGVKFAFNLSSNYGEFVRAVDVLRFEKAETYVLLDDNLWFFQRPKVVSTLEMFGNDVVFIENKEAWWIIIFERIKITWKSSWHLIISFILFLISIYFLQGKNKAF